MTKHTYTNESAPTNTGSLRRPARLNMRLTCSARARTHAVLSGLRDEYGADVFGRTYAEVWENLALLILEHHLRTIRTGDTAIAAYTRAQAKPLPKCDHEREKYKRLKEKYK